MIPIDPLSAFRLWCQAAMTAAEANAIITMRLWGMSGLWSVTPLEATRMWTEKPGAFAKSAGRAAEAVLKGKPPVDVAAAALAPIRSKTRSNARRLARRGPKRR